MSYSIFETLYGSSQIQSLVLEVKRGLIVTRRILEISVTRGIPETQQLLILKLIKYKVVLQKRQQFKPILLIQAIRR